MSEGRVADNAAHRPRRDLARAVLLPARNAIARSSKAAADRGEAYGDARGVHDLVVAEHGDNPATREARFSLQAPDQLETRELIVASIENVANLHKRCVTSRPAALALVIETSNLQNFSKACASPCMSPIATKRPGCGSLVMTGSATAMAARGSIKLEINCSLASAWSNARRSRHHERRIRNHSLLIGCVKARRLAQVCGPFRGGALAC